MKKIVVLFLALQIILVSVAHAQDAAAGGGDDPFKNTRNDILTVAGAGIGGAILGLSTLSFVDRPSKHISNIWTGAAVGVIVGVIFVAYNSAQRGQENMEESEDEEASVRFDTSERIAWHFANEKNLTSDQGQISSNIFQMNF